MQELIDWIDRESARHDFVMRGRKRGLLQRVVRCLIVKYLSWRDPGPEDFRAAIGK